MKKKTNVLITVLHVISWIIFLGLCFKTGTILFSFFATHFIDPVAAKKLYIVLDLSPLYAYDKVYYSIVVSVIIILTAAKALIFYLAIKIFLKINMVHPFSEQIAKYITTIGYVSLGIGVLSTLGANTVKGLTDKGVSFTDLREHLGGSGEYLLLGAVIFMIAQIFKRGIEIQSEHELTV